MGPEDNLFLFVCLFFYSSSFKNITPENQLQTYLEKG